jgi:hypothetical protein
MPNPPGSTLDMFAINAPREVAEEKACDRDRQNKYGFRLTHCPIVLRGESV